MSSVSFFWIAAGVLAQVFQAGVSMVRVDAEVTEGARTVADLRQEDFRILDKGAPQTIRHFSYGEEPLDLVLVFDISGSMKGAAEKVAASAREALGELRKGDRVAVTVFNRKSRLVAPFSDNLEAVRDTLEKDVLDLEFGGGTYLLAAADDAALLFSNEPHASRRRAVLMLTDNYGVRTRRQSTVVNDFWEADAVLSGLIVRDPRFAKAHTIASVLSPGGLLLQQSIDGVASKTGGDVVKADDPGPAFQEMLRRIRARYSLYYILPAGKPGEEHAVRVELSDEALRRYPAAHVHARKGYRYPMNH